MKAVIVADGAHAPSDQHSLAGADLVLAADGGANWLATIGWRPHLVIGDFDSINPDLIPDLERSGVRLDRHPVDKDASDLELCVAAAVAAGADELLILGALGGELDHLVANLLLLNSDLATRLHTSLVHGRTMVRLLAGPAEVDIAGGAGTRVSLLPLGGPAGGVKTSGLRWALDDDLLETGSSRGLANVVTTEPAAVSVATGDLLVIEIATGEHAPAGKEGAA